MFFVRHDFPKEGADTLLGLAAQGVAMGSRRFRKSDIAMFMDTKRLERLEVLKHVGTLWKPFLGKFETTWVLGWVVFGQGR